MKIHFIFLVILSHFCFAQSPKPFKSCAKTITYTVDDYVLRKKVGMDLTIPLSNPTYTGGVEELMKYFKANSIYNSSKTFRTFIRFVVNCKGQIGDFQIGNNTDAEKVPLDMQVLDIVKKMPRKWKPAISKEGKPVDSYQVIALTIIGSKFTDVYYK